MAKVRRGNVVLTVKESLVEHYVARGYDAIKDDGTVVKAVPSDLSSLQAAYVEHVATIEKLKARIAELEASGTSEDKPKRTRTKKDEQ